eukprot:g2427.t1
MSAVGPSAEDLLREKVQRLERKLEKTKTQYERLYVDAITVLRTDIRILEDLNSSQQKEIERLRQHELVDEQANASTDANVRRRGTIVTESGRKSFYSEAAATRKFLEHVHGRPVNTDMFESLNGSTSSSSSNSMAILKDRLDSIVRRNMHGKVHSEQTFGVSFASSRERDTVEDLAERTTDISEIFDDSVLPASPLLVSTALDCVQNWKEEKDDDEKNGEYSWTSSNTQQQLVAEMEHVEQLRDELRSKESEESVFRAGKEQHYRNELKWCNEAVVEIRKKFARRRVSEIEAARSDALRRAAETEDKLHRDARDIASELNFAEHAVESMRREIDETRETHTRSLSSIERKLHDCERELELRDRSAVDELSEAREAHAKSRVAMQRELRSLENSVENRACAAHSELSRTLDEERERSRQCHRLWSEEVDAMRGESEESKRAREERDALHLATVGRLRSERDTFRDRVEEKEASLAIALDRIESLLDSLLTCPEEIDAVRRDADLEIEATRARETATRQRLESALGASKSRFLEAECQLRSELNEERFRRESSLARYEVNEASVVAESVKAAHDRHDTELATLHERLRRCEDEESRLSLAVRRSEAAAAAAAAEREILIPAASQITSEDTPRHFDDKCATCGSWIDGLGFETTSEASTFGVFMLCGPLEMVLRNTHFEERHFGAAVVNSVKEGGAAASLGIRSGDFVYAVGNTRVKSRHSLGDVVGLLKHTKPYVLVLERVLRHGFGAGIGFVS